MSSTGPVLVSSVFLSSPLDAGTGAVLLAGAIAGHTALIVGSHNWWYGSGFSRHVVDAIQLIHGLLLLCGAALLCLFGGLGLPAVVAGAWGSPWQMLLSAYVVVCWGMGFAVLPAVTLWRCLRPRPACLQSNHTATVDIAARLGYKPVGRGKYHHVARLPRNEVFQADLIERTLRLERLPQAWDGLTILHLSDVHFCGTPDKVYFQEVMDLCAAWEPDLVAFTGDLVDTEVHYRWVVPVLGRLKWRCAAYAILGNHDYYYDPPLLRRRLGKIGFHVLGNSWVQTELRGVPLVVIGNETPWFQPGPDLSSCPEGPFRLCLSHTPDTIAWARQHRIDLMLSGHVHGGQIRFPLIGSVVVPSRYGRRYDCGTFEEPPTVLHVSRGLGAEQPLRYNCRPEVTKLILRPAR
jgi:hypothetical protein